MTITLAATALIAPASAICALCGCSAAGDIVIKTMERDALFDQMVATYRHVSSSGCLVARARSERRWSGTPEQEQTS